MGGDSPTLDHKLQWRNKRDIREAFLTRTTKKDDGRKDPLWLVRRSSSAASINHTTITKSHKHKKHKNQKNQKGSSHGGDCGG
jgi:hypothetical protein